MVVVAGLLQNQPCFLRAGGNVHCPFAQHKILCAILSSGGAAFAHVAAKEDIRVEEQQHQGDEKCCHAELERHGFSRFFNSISSSGVGFVWPRWRVSRMKSAVIPTTHISTICFGVSLSKPTPLIDFR